MAKTPGRSLPAVHFFGLKTSRQLARSNALQSPLIARPHYFAASSTSSCCPTNVRQSHSIQLRLPEADTNFKSTFDRYLPGCSIPNFLQDCKRRQAHSHRHAVSIKLPALNQSFRLVDEHNRKGSGQVSLKPSQGVHATAKWTKFHLSFIEIVFSS